MIQYNKPIQVTKEQVKYLQNDLSGIIAYRYDQGKWYIKVLMMNELKRIRFFFKIRGVML